MDFEELSNEEWALLAPILSIQPIAGVARRGRPRLQPRVLVNAILWVLTVGGSWSKVPARYPSPPTCRCRFEEWRSDGKLGEIVRILSATGRSFSYAIDSPSSETVSTLSRDTASIGEYGIPLVRWRCQESWHASTGTRTHLTETSVAYTQTRDTAEEVSLRETSLTRPTPSKAADEPCDSSTHRTLWMGLASNGMTVTNAEGYVVYVAVDTVAGAKFRGWTEIIRDGKRLTRSGLVGQKFCTPEAATQFALGWAQRWIEQHANCAPTTDLSRASKKW